MVLNTTFVLPVVDQAMAPNRIKTPLPKHGPVSAVVHLVTLIFRGVQMQVDPNMGISCGGRRNGDQVFLVGNSNVANLPSPL